MKSRLSQKKSPVTCGILAYGCSISGGGMRRIFYTYIFIFFSVEL